MREIVFDVEADDLLATKLHCLSYCDVSTGEIKTLIDYDDIREFFTQDVIFVGHNIRRWDIPTLERLLGISLKGKTFVDTLGVLWYLEPGRKKAGLEAIGEEIGIKKPEVLDWQGNSLFVYVNRCETDVRINTELWKTQKAHLLEIYQEPSEVFSFLKYLDFKMYCAHLAEASGWKLDIKRCEDGISELEEEYNRKRASLEANMPRVPIIRSYSRPKRRHNADGKPSVLEQRWQERLKAQGLPEGYEGDVEEIVGYSEPNSGSSDQRKAWLYSLGWEPRTFKTVRSKTTGETREIPQIYKEKGEGAVCDSVRELFDVEPALEDLDSLGVLGHRIGILKGFLRDHVNGRLKASIAGLTNTLRFKHAEIVNLPKPEVPYGSVIRGCLIADDGNELCGADMSGVQDRLKQHFIYKYDPDYVRDLQSDDYDPHLDIAVLAGGLRIEDTEFYKKYTDGEDPQRYKAVKSKRSTFKNGNYACQFGAMPARLMKTCGIDKKSAENLYKVYWQRNWAIKEVAKDQEIREVRGMMWLRNPISGFWYSLRYEKDIFVTLVQGSESYCFDTWLSFILDERDQLTGQFHDEVILEVRKGYRDEITEFLEQTIRDTNQLLGLNVELGIGIQYGDRYSEIH